MHSFIKVTSVNTNNPFIIAVDTIDSVVNENGKTCIQYRDASKSIVKETIDEMWAMLKPSIIFA